MNIETLNGETIANIDVSDDNMRITTKSGRIIEFYHQQDCCERVYIHDAGNLHQFVGRVIDSVSQKTDGDLPKGEDEEYYESYTVTDFIFKIDNNTEIVRWIGSSNGYYSESVDIADITFKRNQLIPENWENPDKEGWKIIADYWDDLGEHTKSNVIRELLNNGDWNDIFQG